MYVNVLLIFISCFFLWVDAKHQQNYGKKQFFNWHMCQFMQKFDRIQLNVFHFICFIITVVAHQFDNYDVIEHGNHVITFSTRSAHQHMNQLNLCKNWHDIYIQYLIFCITLYMVNVFFFCVIEILFFGFHVSNVPYEVMIMHWQRVWKSSIVRHRNKIKVLEGLYVRFLLWKKKASIQFELNLSEW